jgi:hypothetical protein
MPWAAWTWATYPWKWAVAVTMSMLMWNDVEELQSYVITITII